MAVITQADLLILAGSGLAVGLLVLFLALMGFRRNGKLETEAEVIALIQAHEPGVMVGDIGRDRRGNAAGARLGDGRFAVVRAVADGFAVRLFTAAQVRSVALRRRAGTPVAIIRFSDVGFPALTIAFDRADFPPWVEALRHAARSA